VQPREEVGHRQALTVDHSVPLCEIAELFRGTVDWNPEFQLTIHVFCLVASALSTQRYRTGAVAESDSCMSLPWRRISRSSSTWRELHSPADRVVGWNTSIPIVGRSGARNSAAGAWRLIPCASRDERAVELSIE